MSTNTETIQQKYQQLETLKERFPSEVKNKDFIFAGVTQDPNNSSHGSPIGQPASGEPLYRVLTPQEINKGIHVYEAMILLNDIDEMKQMVQNFIDFD